MSFPGEKLDLKIPQGATYERVIRWETEPFLWKAITVISKAAGAPRLTVIGHAMPNGWRCAVRGVQGMRQINAENWPPRARDFQRGTVLDANTVELNEVDASGFSAYTSGGFLVFYTPKDLAGCQARMTIRDVIGGTSLIALTSSPAAGIALDDEAKTITLTLSAAQTAAFEWTRGVYDLEVVNPGNRVHRLFYGNVIVTPKEVTT